MSIRITFMELRSLDCHKFPEEKILKRNIESVTVYFDDIHGT